MVSRDAVSGQLAGGRLVAVTAPGTPLHRPWHAVTTGRIQSSTALLIDHLLQTGDGGWTR